MLTRRRLLQGVLAATTAPLPTFGHARAAAIGALDAADEGLAPGAPEDQGGLLSRALVKAEANSQPLFLPPGAYQVREVVFPPHAHLVGIPGRTRLLFGGGRFMLRAANSALLRIEGVTVEGSGLPLDPSVRGLLDADGVDDLALEDCRFAGSSAAGAMLRGCSGRIERVRVEDVRTVGLNVEQSRGMLVADNVVLDCGDTGILVQRDEESGDDTIVRGNRVSGIRADSGGTGQNGNGINISKANGVLVVQNRVDGCAFSAIRCFSSDNVQVAGNTATNSGEVAVFVEFAFEGAVVQGNLIDGCVGGISFANLLDYGGRLATCSGNLVRNSRSGPRYADGNAQPGYGISAEADVAISGNVVESAVIGLQLGWGPYRRDVSATGNVIRRTEVGIAVSVADGVGAALIADNLISEASRAAILGMRWEEPASGDLSREGAESFPLLTIEGNRVS